VQKDEAAARSRAIAATFPSSPTPYGNHDSIERPAGRDRSAQRCDVAAEKRGTRSRGPVPLLDELDGAGLRVPGDRGLADQHAQELLRDAPLAAKSRHPIRSVTSGSHPCSDSRPFRSSEIVHVEPPGRSNVNRSDSPRTQSLSEREAGRIGSVGGGHGVTLSTRE